MGKGQGEHGPEDEDLHKSHIIPAWEHCRTQEYKLIEHDTPQSLLLTCPALWMLIEYSIHLCEKLSEICSMADDCLGSVTHRKGLGAAVAVAVQEEASDDHLVAVADIR